MGQNINGDIGAPRARAGGRQYQLLATRYGAGTRTNHQVGAAFALEL
jgi:hypothetical protein